MIKLADRLHNMRTLGAQSREARGRIARETLEIYAPIAQRLGMSLVKSELQNLGFKALYPWRHAILEKHIRSQPVVRREAMAQVEVQLSQRLAKEGLEHRLVSRIKTPWSIYNKMHDENKSFDQVMDVFGFRLVVRNVPSAYHALGAVHATFKPLDGRFRDFIAIPKANGYQSLHTVLFGPYGSPIEVQIRTEEMDLIAERGVAAHWTYKFGGDSPNSAQSRAHAWIVELIDSQRAAGSSLEFLDNVKVDLFPDEVYLFTPKGKILALPRNSTALDFAYAVHTDVGNMAVASRVDKKLVPLRTKLVSGQTVEVITARSATPKPQWLEFVVSSKARTAIRHQLKQLEHEDAVQLGHRMLDRALEAMDSSLERLPKGRLDAFLAEHRYPRLEALLAEVALGNWMPNQAAQALMAYAELRGGAHSKHSQEKILINGSERGVVSFANCCQPIPGDDIMGYHTAGKGIVVHRMDCWPNCASRPSAGCPSAGTPPCPATTTPRWWWKWKTAPACWPSWPRRSPRAIPTSNAWTTSTAISTPRCWPSTSRSATATTWPRSCADSGGCRWCSRFAGSKTRSAKRVPRGNDGRRRSSRTTGVEPTVGRLPWTARRWPAPTPLRRAMGTPPR
jgi:guanosine-3',5'-bis(diphosphate) 3'-pyrophosphohydrolase